MDEALAVLVIENAEESCSWKVPNIIIVIWISPETPDPSNASFLATHFREKHRLSGNLLGIPVLSNWTLRSAMFPVQMLDSFGIAKGHQLVSFTHRLSSQEPRTADPAWLSRLTPLKTSHLELASQPLVKSIVIIHFYGSSSLSTISVNGLLLSLW